MRSKIEQYFERQQYAEAVEMLENEIEQTPTEVLHYWYLGLALLLQGQEAEAQEVWMAPFLEAEPEQTEQWIADLAQLIKTEAVRQASQLSYETAWLLHQHLRNFVPDDLANLLAVLRFGLNAHTFSLEDDLLFQIAQLLREESYILSVDLNQLSYLITELLNFDAEAPIILLFIEACIPHYIRAQQSDQVIALLMTQALNRFYFHQKTIAIWLIKHCLRLNPDDLQVLKSAVFILQATGPSYLLESVPLAKRLLEKSANALKKIDATHHVLQALMLTCGSWQEIHQYYKQHKALLSSLIHSMSSTGQLDQNNSSSLELDGMVELINTGTFFHYFEDAPTTNRPLRNQIAKVAQDAWRLALPDYVDHHYRPTPNHQTISKRLRIGYLSSCFRLHSVGWLVRWLLLHHDRERFDVHLYSTKKSNDPLQQAFYTAYGENFHSLPNVTTEIAHKVVQDQVDILVDLDSLTDFHNCVVMALKPAPIQVSWLGFDASGIPAIDYYIVDPYVVPSNAQNYYSETLWHLPQTYIAVDGFEVGVPSLRRDQLNIPNDAIVYLSSQTGLKRNPDNIRLQLQILQQVPNSYFLVKSFDAQPELLQTFFLQLAEEEGVSGDRLRFLPDFPENSVYRANLGLADVILDTYPYNGATTTLEALWVGLPIVTRVGEQFAARNSYTMMTNAGVTAGVAWTDEEYVEWGIRLGTDAKLRQKVTYQLWKSRQASPLWNAPQFTREMEKAYTQMWARYLES